MPIEELFGLPLRYLIGRDPNDYWEPHSDEIIEVGYNTDKQPKKGFAIKYGNLFDQSGTKRFGPYLDQAGSALAYNQLIPDPKGTGYYRNIHDQLERAQKFGFKLIEWDNADNENFKFFDLKRAIDVSMVYKIGVIFKNPGILKVEDVPKLIEHPNVFGIIVSERCGTPHSMDKLRKDAKKPNLPIWFVSFGNSEWAQSIAIEAKKFLHMGVTFSDQGEYENSIDILKPTTKLPVGEKLGSQ